MSLEKKLALVDEIQSACTHCGICSEGCATFQATGWELESPRGRIRLARDFIHGHIQPKSQVLETFDRCLACHACESLCPSQVRYGELRNLVQEVRTELGAHPKTVASREKYKAWIRTAQRLSSWLRRAWRHICALRFCRKQRHSHNRPDVHLIVSCVQDAHRQAVIEASVNILDRLGFNAVIDRCQPCCGAIFERLIGCQEGICYPKEQARVRNYQRKSLQSFLKKFSAQPCFLSMDCQCFVKRHADQTNAIDIHAYILNVLHVRQQKLVLPQPLTVYYQSYCGAQKTTDAAQTLLQSIEGLHVKYLNNPSACCGGYGQEALWHPEHAQRILENKLNGVPQGGTLVVTSADCYAQMKRHTHFNVKYPLEIAVLAFS